jgi:polyvinyl alcohol dehydrogenase (cytochrome)
MRFVRLILALPVLCSAQDAAAIYQSRCASCHDSPTGRIPATSALKAMNSTRIMVALGGVMKAQGEGLSSAEKYALVVYLSSPAVTRTAPPASAMCGSSRAFDPSKVPHWNGWGVDFENSRFQPANEAGITALDVPKLKLKWAYWLGDQSEARAQPSVAGGRLFVGNDTGVDALDAASGCLYWSFHSDAPVRASITITKGAVYFGDQHANVYAVDALTGKLLWKQHIDDHFAAVLTGSLVLHAGVLYVPVSSFEEALAPAPNYECCTFRGGVVALEASTGKRLWKAYTVADPPQPTVKSKTGVQMRGPSGAPIWSEPTFDEKRNAIYVATGDNYSDPPTTTSDAVVAIDAKTGKILWSKQFTANDAYNSSCDVPGKINCPASDGPDSDFGQPPILVALGGGKRALVLGQKSGMVHAIDPDHEGALLWEVRAGKGGKLGGVQWGSAADRERMYVAVSDLGLGAQLDPKSPAGYSLTADPKKGGGLHAYKLATGKEVWSAKAPDCGDRKHCSPAQSAAVTAIPGAVFSGSVDGHLRAYSSSTGEVLWDFDTAREFDAVNGAKAHGGSIDGPGPVIVGGMLYVNSGYGQWGGMPGNVLLAFSIR